MVGLKLSSRFNYVTTFTRKGKNGYLPHTGAERGRDRETGRDRQRERGRKREDVCV